MRIVAGEFKGRRLEAPEGNDVRPTSEKVKEAVFSMLMNELPGSVCMDLFAGTGNLGLEAISRGAEKCYFSDSARASLDMIKRNIKHCRAEDKSVVLSGDYLRNLKRIEEKLDIIFIDPPYKDGLYESCFENIEKLDLLAKEGTIVAEHSASIALPEVFGSFEKIKDRRYGRIGVSIYRHMQ